MRIENIDELIDTNLGKEGRGLWKIVGDDTIEHYYKGVIREMLKDYAEQTVRELKRKYRVINRTKWV